MATFKRKADVLTASAADLKKPKRDSSLTSFFGAPKAVAPTQSSGLTSDGAVPEASPVKFDKDKWISSLRPEQRDLLKLEIDTLDPSWLAHLKDEVTSPEFLNLKRFLQKEIQEGKKIFPPLEDIYSWSRHTPLPTVKAVILGQDPYHNVNQAHGLCFSVRPPTPAPPSLLNMYKALERDYPSFKRPANRGGLLTPWANQGVLMLNTCLTVRAHDANSHAGKGWERFTQKVIDTVAKVRTRGVVFLAWGLPAQKRCAGIKSAKHIVLKEVHPSPMAQARGNFIACGHFKKTNEWLKERYGTDGEINWNLDQAKPISTPSTTTPVKVTEQQVKLTEEDVLFSESSKSKGEQSVTKGEDFEGEEDEDAIEALEELAKSSAAGGEEGGQVAESDEAYHGDKTDEKD